MRKLLLATGTLLLMAGLVGSRWEHWVMEALAPDTPFDARAAPPAPDYSDLSAWTALPQRRDAADVAPVGFQTINQTSAPVDVFYVHPTSYLGSAWNGPVGEPRLNAQTDELSTLIQASAFNGCCAIYGPRYRQANGDAFIRPGPDGAAAIDLAYGDVLAAFRFFLEHYNRGRPFILASHSQGSVLAARLLQREISDTGLMQRLVAAYVIGGPIDSEPSPSVPACAAPEKTGCIVGWNARGPHFRGSVFDFRPQGKRLCVNPLTWRHDESPADAGLNQGAVFLHAGDGTPLPGFADARCQGGWLIVSKIGRPPRDFMSRMLDFVIGPENYHPIDYQLYYMNLRRNAQDRVSAYLREQANDAPARRW